MAVSPSNHPRVAFPPSIASKDRNFGVHQQNVESSLPPQKEGRDSVPPFISPTVLSGFLRFLETGLILCMGGFVWLNSALNFSPFSAIINLLALGGGAFAIPFIFKMRGHYMVPHLLHPRRHLNSFLSIFFFVFLSISFVFLFASFEKSSEIEWIARWGGLSFILVVLWRFLSALVIRNWNKKGQLAQRALLIGGGYRAKLLIEALESSLEQEIKVIGICDDRNDERSPEQVLGYPKLGPISQAIDIVRQRQVDLLAVTFPLTAEHRLSQVLNLLWILPVDIRLSAHMQELRFRPHTYSYVGNVPFLDLADKPISHWNKLIKRAEDVILGCLFLLLLSPVMALIAFAVMLESKGPIFFKQRRYGFNNELIEVYKFRSMYTDQCDREGARSVMRHDPRVTLVGRFIRRTSLDELPQLFNVLKGELSLVGPRPHATQSKAGDRLFSEVADAYFARYKVKPGMTGWAQINGWRGGIEHHEQIQRRVEHDLYYIENWSLLFDLEILLRTPFAILKGENAF